MSNLYRFAVLLLLSVWGQYAYSDDIHLHIPIMSDTPKQHHYFHELISTALTEIGHNPKLVVNKYPQSRIQALLDTGAVSIFWMVASAERDNRYTPIKVNITNNLIGMRILFIKQGDQPLYDNVKSLEDFRNLNLVGGMGKNWFDAKVWRANNLNYLEHSGAWQFIFKMIPMGRSYNYFSRGLNEILAEAKQYPELAIEKNLALIYDRDFRFYLSKIGPNAGEKYKKILTNALLHAKETGLIDRLVRKYWAKDFETLNYDKRIKINLSTPF
jgi:hypothetical protein